MGGIISKTYVQNSGNALWDTTFYRPPAELPVDDDTRLAVDDWFDRIRARRAAGDFAGARASLARLRDAHPDAAIPDDLADLR